MLAALLALACTGAQAQSKFVTLASTTSTEQSGLFKHLLPIYAQKVGVEVRVIAVGTGQALDMGRKGDADVVFRNPQAFPVKADIVFDVKSADDRKLTVLSKVDGAVLWSGATIEVLREVRIRGVVLPPGDILWRFESDLPPDQPNIGDPRKVSFSVRNLEIRITGRGVMEEAGAAK